MTDLTRLPTQSKESAFNCSERRLRTKWCGRLLMGRCLMRRFENEAAVVFLFPTQNQKLDYLGKCSMDWTRRLFPETRGDLSYTINHLVKGESPAQSRCYSSTGFNETKLGNMTQTKKNMQLKRKRHSCSQIQMTVASVQHPRTWHRCVCVTFIQTAGLIFPLVTGR